MLPILMSLAITTSVGIHPYNKYACSQVVKNGVAIAEPFYGTSADYNNQPITLPDHILIGTNATTPINIVGLSQYWKASVVDGGSTDFFFTHTAKDGVEINGTSVILKKAIINNGETQANVNINTYSSTCANLLGNYLKTHNYTYLYSMEIKVTQAQMKQILSEMDSNSTINSMVDKELVSQEFSLGQHEASYIATHATNVSYFNPQDIFKEGNKLIANGTIKGSGMNIPANTPDLMEVPDGSSYSQSMVGVLYSFPPKPKNVPTNTQTVAQYQEAQDKAIQKNNSVSTPVQGMKPIVVPTQTTAQPINNQQPPSVPLQDNSSGFNLGDWILYIGIGIAAIIFGVVGVVWYKRKKGYDDEEDDYPEFK